MPSLIVRDTKNGRVKEVDLAKLADEAKSHGVEKQVILASTKYDQIRTWRKLIPDGQTLLWMGGTEEKLHARFGRTP